MCDCAIASIALGIVTGIAIRACDLLRDDEERHEREQPLGLDDPAPVVDERERLAVVVDQDSQIRLERVDDPAELAQVARAVGAEIAIVFSSSK